MVILFLALIIVSYYLLVTRREIDFKVEQRVAQTAALIREDALERSRATLKGQVAEQIVPFLKAFKYRPSDARFIGSPIDYVIFDGYSETGPITVILADVKTGPSAGLTSTQRRIKEAVEKGLVRWETIQIQG